MNALGVDVSHWQPRVDWPLLRKAGVSFAIIKASQGVVLHDNLLRSHFSGAKSAGMLTGVYHWVDPTQSVARQIKFFLQNCKGLDFDFAGLDIEQYWQSWQEWGQRQVVHVLSPERISQAALEAAKNLRSIINKPIVIYTSANFVQTYAEPMQDWLSDWPLWLAHYPYQRERITLTWEALFKDHLPKIAGPNMPTGLSEWRFWQFSGDRFVLPGVETPLDLDYFNGSEQQLRAWCSGQPEEIKEIPDGDKLQLLWQAHPELSRP